MPIHYISEQTIRKYVTQAQVLGAIEAMYEAIGRGQARNFPTVREQLDYADAVFGFKSGFEPARGLLGIKAGGLWPANGHRNLENHQSTVLLFDPECGRPTALVRGNYLTALRTAAASALSIRYFARTDCKVLGIIGAGGQAEYQVRAALAEREFDSVLVADLEQRRAMNLQSRLADVGPEVKVSTFRELAEAADVLITITPATTPVVMREWIRPGTHVACMGADTKGKHEVEASLVAAARVFVDDREQAARIGECQHACSEGLLEVDDLVFIGDVITGCAPGRTDEQQTTLFDSSGVGLQDLVAARLALEIASQQGALTVVG